MQFINGIHDCLIYDAYDMVVEGFAQLRVVCHVDFFVETCTFDVELCFEVCTGDCVFVNEDFVLGNDENVLIGDVLGNDFVGVFGHDRNPPFVKTEVLRFSSFMRLLRLSQ